MNDTNSTVTVPVEEKKITKKILNKVVFRSFFEDSTINYERFQALGFLYAIDPALKKLYPDNERYVKAAKRHMEMYNSTEYMINPILGTTIALEEKIANMEGEDTSELEKSVNSVKVGLMGPLAGIGDSLIYATIRPIIAAVCAGLALAGSGVGPVLFLVLFNILMVGFRFFSTSFGYKKGASMMRSLRETNIIQKLSEGASVLGLMVLGCLVAQWVSFSISKSVVISGAEINIQALLDSVIPGLLPLGLTMLLVFLLNKKISTGWLVAFVFALALVLSLVGF